MALALLKCEVFDMELILSILVIIIAFNYKKINNFLTGKTPKPIYSASNPPKLKRQVKTHLDCPFCGHKIPLENTSGLKNCPKCDRDISPAHLTARARYLEYKQLERTGGLFCPVCGEEDVYITCIKGVWGNTHPAYQCSKCKYIWKWRM